jgi:ABC-2 type transport system ATP-binding protein
MLEVRNVSKRYGALTAVRQVSFAVRPGEVLGYLGPNGSGKSTTVKMLVGLMPPTSGTIVFDGQDIQEHLLEYKAMVGYVPEEAHVYTYLTGPEYLRLTGRLRGLADRVIEAKIDRFLKLFGLDTDYHAPLSAFSKGMRQKVLLSAALMHNPRVVVLDEPVSGLDVSTALVLRTMVRSLAADGRIIFYSSHELDTIERISTRVMILHEGRVVADDSPARLRELANVPSLEDVFAKLAVRQDLEAMASALIETVRL